MPAECRELCLPLDRQGLLSGGAEHLANPEADLDDDALLAELGIEAEAPEITELRYVRSNAERKAAEDVANREACADFEKFKPLFEQVQRELDTGMRETRPFELKAEIEKGRFFIVGGQKAYVAEKGEQTLTDQGRTDARLRVIFDNGTESNMLMRSLQRALNKDDAGRRITDPVAGPLFGIVLNFVYLARSMRFQILKRRSARRTLWRTGCGPQTIPGRFGRLSRSCGSQVNQLGRRLVCGE